MPCASFAADSGPGGPVSLRDLHAAYAACRRGKRHARNTLAYEARLLDRLVDTRDALNARRWRPSRTLCFAVNEPKPREIHAADFGDRVVHHWLVPRLEAWFEPVFIHDSYSNRRGKGTHAAVSRLRGFLDQVTRNGKRKAHCLQLDIANFFNSIDRAILYCLLRRRAERIWRAARRPHAAAAPADEAGRQDRLAALHAGINHCLWLCRSLLAQDAGAGAAVRGAARQFARVPAHKRLCNAPPGVGLPIGNLTSQFFANVYLDRLDQFVKHELKCRHYLRYVDDFVLLHEDPAQLLAWRGRIADFLARELRLRLKAASAPRPVGAGIDFLGYVTRRSHTLPRRRVLRRAQARLARCARAVQGGTAGFPRLDWRPARREAVRAALASTLGHLAHADARRAARELWRAHPWLRAVFDLDLDRLRLRARFEPPSVASFAGQKRWFARRFPARRVWLRKGREYVLADAPAGAPGLPAAHLPARLAAWRRAGIGYAVVEETGYLKRGLKRRVLVEIGWPRPAGPRSPCPPSPRPYGAAHAR